MEKCCCTNTILKTVSNLIWLGVLAFAWPFIHLTVFYFRFGQQLPADGLGGALVFLPMGFLSGALLLFLLNRSTTTRQSRLTIGGYLAAAPFAFVGSLLSGLASNPYLGVALFGGGPLALGAWLGFHISRTD
jgi:hypothetical protein